MSLPRLPELLIILFIVLLVFGAAKLPDVASSLGRSIKEFRKNAQPEEDSSSQKAASQKIVTEDTKGPMATDKK